MIPDIVVDTGRSGTVQVISLIDCAQDGFAQRMRSGRARRLANGTISFPSRGRAHVLQEGRYRLCSEGHSTIEAQGFFCSRLRNGVRREKEANMWRTHRVLIAFVTGFVLAVSLGGVLRGEVPFRRGDVDASGAVDLGDPLANLLYLFSGGSAPACMDAADTDDSGRIDLSDVIVALQWLFVGAAPPPEPGPGFCGADPTDDFLDCASYAACVVLDVDGDGMDDDWERSYLGSLEKDGEDDTDGDGLSDIEEHDGWMIVVDKHGYGTDALGKFLITRYVTSDPTLADTDGDGLEDEREHGLRADPGDPDTDDDGLLDGEEWSRWHTSPVSVDTDGDCRGPDGKLPPRQVLFDGDELFLLGTSPTLDDTDGDAWTDQEEYDHPFRSPRIADLPRLELEVVDDLDVRLDVEFAEEQGQTRQYGGELTTSDTTRNNEYREGTVNWGLTIGAELAATTGFFSEVRLKLSAEVSVGGSHMIGYEKEDSHTTQESWSEYTTDARTRTETAASGSITMGIRLRNTGEIAYTLTDLGYTVRRWQPGLDPEDPGATGTFQTVCTMSPVLGGFPGDITRGITLAPGEASPVMLVEASDVNASRIKDLLARPDSLHLEPAFYALENDEGLHYSFLEEVTRSRTGTLIIDFGDGDAEEYRVATNVDRTSSGAYAGVSLGTVLAEILEIPFETRPRQQLQPGAPTNEQVLFSVRNLQTVLPQRFWTTIVTGDAPGSPEVDFEDISLHAGKTVLLALIRDEDQDGLTAPEEQHYGTSDEEGDTDTDGDGLSDEEEMRGEVFVDLDGHEIPCGWVVVVEGREAYPVWSDPRNPDQDGDGWNDSEEKLQGTDPTLRDTDRDGLHDGLDPYPLVRAGVLYVKPSGAGARTGISWDDAADLAEALLSAAAKNGDAEPQNDIAEIWVARGLYLPDSGTDRTASFELAPGLGLYGGFIGGETTQSARVSNSLQNRTILSGDLLGDGDDDNNSYHVVVADLGVGGIAALDGFTIADGNADGAVASARDRGAGLLVSSGTPLLRNLFFRDNQAVTRAGAICLDSAGPLEISSSVFYRNVARYGGAVGLADGIAAPRLVLGGCEFTANQAQYGGALHYRAASGGQILADQCLFQWNVATGAEDSGGGAVYLNVGIAAPREGKVTITNSRFQHNEARKRGGAVCAYSHTRLQIFQSMFWRNSCYGSTPPNFGGAISFFGVVPSGQQGRLEILNSTFSRNYVVGQGTDLSFEGGGGGGDTVPLTIQNSILWYLSYEAAQGNGEIYWPVGTDLDVFVSNSHIMQTEGLPHSRSSEWTFVHLRWEDPELVDGWGGDLRLQEGSPCIDAGISFVDTDPLDPATYVPLPLLDLGGGWRIIDGDSNGVPQVDIGAFEYQGE